MGFQASIAGVLAALRRRGWQRNDSRLLSFRMVPSSVETVAENGSYGRVTFTGRVGFLGRIDSFSLTLSHVHMFPLFPAYSFAFTNFLTTSFYLFIF